MKMKMNLISGIICASAITLPVGAQERDVKINEIVVDPKRDHNLDGKITDSDEYVEIYNASLDASYNLKGWKLELNDTTPETLTLEDIVLTPKSFYVIQNPRGAQNNDGEIKLYNSFGKLVDRITYGNWNQNSEIPNGNASGSIDESLSKFPDGSMNWIKTYATPGFQNIARERIKPRLFIEIAKEGEREGMNIQVISFPPARFILQKSYNLLGGWENVFTNELPEISFTYSDFDFKSTPQSFYRAIEYVE